MQQITDQRRRQRNAAKSKRRQGIHYKVNPQNLGENERKFKMAIDETDGAMRVLDPIISALQNKEPQYGKLFKNYREYKW